MRGINSSTLTTNAGSSTLLSEAKTASKRIVLEINNAEAAGGNDVYITIDGEAAANKGRRVQPGQTITWSMDGGYTPPQQRVTAYCAAAVTLVIYEEVEQ